MPIKLPTFRPRRGEDAPDLWTKCPSCEEMLFNRQLDKSLRVCPNCGHHFRLGAQARLDHLLDGGSFTEHDAGLVSVDALGFVDQKPYPDRVAAAQLATGLRDAAVWGIGRIDGTQVAIVVMDFGFMGGSMGAVVGEKVARAAEHAALARMPLVIVSASGGARMQEGTLALMQLAKTMGALERLRDARVPYISILSDPTTGGVFASFAAVGDVNLAEPNALIGFAGARVSAGTIAQELPPGFQRAEFLFEHGFVDRVVTRSELRGELARLLRYLVSSPHHPDEEGETNGAVRGPLGFLGHLADRVFEPVEAMVGNGQRTADPATPVRASTPLVATPSTAPTATSPMSPISPATPATPATASAESAAVVPDPTGRNDLAEQDTAPMAAGAPPRGSGKDVAEGDRG